MAAPSLFGLVRLQSKRSCCGAALLLVALLLPPSYVARIAAGLQALAFSTFHHLTGK